MTNNTFQEELKKASEQYPTDEETLAFLSGAGWYCDRQIAEVGQ